MRFFHGDGNSQHDRPGGRHLQLPVPLRSLDRVTEMSPNVPTFTMGVPSFVVTPGRNIRRVEARKITDSLSRPELPEWSNKPSTKMRGNRTA